MTQAPGSRPHDGIVCLGASAGGLRSLQEVLGALPPEFPWPILVALHVKPEPPALLPPILARATKLAVREAKHGDMLQAGTVYVCPSDVEIGVTPDLRIATRPRVHGRPQRIDFLFATCASAARAQTVAVVLSGEGSDGAAGALVVKLNGGTVIAEREASAAHSSMPHAAGAAGAVDAFRDRSEIGQLLIELADGRLREANEAAEQGIDRIVQVIAEKDGPDFARYRRGTLTRRIQKRMAMSGFGSAEEYRERLLVDADERDALRQSLLVLVTEFFRDPDTWAFIEGRVVPDLVARLRTGASLRVWSAGCATGEEAYTIGMLLCEAYPDASAGNVEIVATDLDEASLAQARTGSYHETRVRNVPAPLLARYFQPHQDTFRVDERLRSLVHFTRSDLTREAPEGPFDMVVCRNVLIYFGEDLQARVFSRIEERLVPGGFLVLGQSETPPRQEPVFVPVAEKMRIVLKKGQEGGRPFLNVKPEGDTKPETTSETATRYHRFMGDALMASTSMLAFIVDERMTVLTTNRLGRSLLGALAERDLLAAPGGTRLRESVRLAIASGRAERLDAVELDRERDLRFDLTIDPLPRSDRAVLVVGTPVSVRGAPYAVHPLNPSDTVADLLATNEELQAANEELAATNEELQSANEELASLNEEFQSNNEMLDTRNDELESGAGVSRSRIVLLRAMIAAGKLAIIACDAEQNVVVCTAQAARLLGVSSDSLGKPITRIGIPVPAATLQAWLERAQTGKTPLDLEHAGLRGTTLEVQIEHLDSLQGGSAGWVLAWRDAAEG